jgi:hypothetical protein
MSLPSDVRKEEEKEEERENRQDGDLRVWDKLRGFDGASHGACPEAGWEDPPFGVASDLLLNELSKLVCIGQPVLWESAVSTNAALGVVLWLPVTRGRRWGERQGRGRYYRER